MPPKITQEKAANFKNRFVGKYPEWEKEERLPDDLRGLWSDRKYKEFLVKALEKLELSQIFQEIYPTLLNDLSDKKEVLELLQDIDCTYKKSRTYFSGEDRRTNAKKVIKAGDRLPADLKESFFKKKRKCRKEFLKKALREFASNFELSGCLLEICPQLGSSSEQEVHELVQQFYYNYTYQNDTVFTESRYEYIAQVVSTGHKELCPDDWVDEWCPDVGKIIEESKAAEAASLAQLKKRLLGNNYLHVAKLTFKVESEFYKECQGTPELQGGSLLFKAAKKFVSSLDMWFKLDGKFRNLPGVYFLYYTGNHTLYTRIGIEKYDPMYVGMSTSDISARLADHHAKIREAKDLHVADFAVKVMIVDNRHYAPCIEGMFIEHFSPIWNMQTVGICFGGGSKSLWKKIHVDQDPDSISKVLEWLKIHGDNSESCSDSESSEE